MRRYFVALGTLVAALTLAASASADKPSKFPTPFSPFEGIVGTPTQVCPFNTLITPVANDGFGIFHVQKDGSSWFWGGGHNTATVLNEDTGKSMTINATGPGKITFNDDGSIDLIGGGHWFVFDTAADPSPDAPSITLYSGYIHIHQDDVNGTQIVQYNGTAPIDICQALA